MSFFTKRIKKFKRRFQPEFIYVAKDLKEIHPRHYFAIVPEPKPGTAWVISKYYNGLLGKKQIGAILNLEPYKHKSKDKLLMIIRSERVDYLEFGFIKYPIEMWEILCERQSKK